MDLWLEEIEAEEELQVSEGRALLGSMVGRRRIAITWAVGEAWETFSQERVEVIRHSFRVVGLSLPMDGSKDLALSIKGLANDFLVEGLKEWRIGENVDDDGEDVEDLEEAVDVSPDEEINFVYE